MANESPTSPQFSHGSCRSSEGRMTACPPDQRRPPRRVSDEQVSLAQHVGHDTAVDDRLSWRAADPGAALERPCAQKRYICIASIQNVERSLLLLVVSTSDIPLRTIKFFSVLFSLAYSSMLQAVTNKHSMVRRRLCDLHCVVVGNCFCHFVVRKFSNRSIASGTKICLFVLTWSTNVTDGRTDRRTDTAWRL